MNRLTRGVFVLIATLILSPLLAAPIDDAAGLLKDKKYPDAEAAFRKVLSSNPNDTQALEGLAEALNGQNKSDEAAKTFERLANELANDPAQKSPAGIPAGAIMPEPAQSPQSAAAAQPNATTPQNVTHPTTLGATSIGEVLNPNDPQDKSYTTTKKRTLDGWFVKTEISHFGGNRLICTYYRFGTDGSVYCGAPTGSASAADFAALQKAHPGDCGTYTIAGEQLILQKAGGPREEHTYSPALGRVMDDEPLQAVVMFKDGARLDGTWSIDYSATFGGVHSVSSNTWIFHPDGTFEHHKVGGVESTSHILGTGTSADAANATGINAPIEKGRYEFAGGKLKVTGTDGRSQSYPAWGVGSAEKPSPLEIDGVELNQER